MTQLQEQQMKMAEELLASEKHKPSFAKLLYAGIFDAERVLPYPDPGPDERRRADQFLAELNAYCDEHLDPAAIDRNAEIPQSVIDGLGGLGLLGMTIPPEFGGQGRSQYAYCRAMESIGGRCGGTAVFVNAHHSIGLRALYLFGTDAQKQRWLAPLARGEVLAAFALTEEQAGSDAANVQTRAVFDPSQNVYRINGKKQWITNGGVAGVLTLMARTEIQTKRGTEDKITAFLVTPDMPGFQVDNVALEKMSIRGTKTAKLSFHDMLVPAENVLGPKGQGLKIALTVLDFGRLTFGACCTGSAKECLRRAIEHAKTRVQFQRPLKAYGLIQQKLARMAALTYAMDATTFLTAGLLDRGEGDFMLETAMLKVFTSESLWWIANETLQVLGGKAFFYDQPYERYLRDARLNLVGEGANEVMRIFLVGLTGMRDTALEMQDIWTSLKNPFRGVPKALSWSGRAVGRFFGSPQVPIQSQLLQPEARQLAAAVRRFGFSVQRVIARHQEGLLDEQPDVNRIADAAMAIFTTTAVLGKLDADLARVGGDQARLGNDVAIAKLYVSEAMDTLDRSLRSLFDRRDAEIARVSNLLTGSP